MNFSVSSQFGYDICEAMHYIQVIVKILRPKLFPLYTLKYHIAQCARTQCYYCLILYGFCHLSRIIGPICQACTISSVPSAGVKALA